MPEAILCKEEKMKWMVYLYYIQFKEKTLENHWDSLAISQHLMIDVRVYPLSASIIRYD